MGLLALKFDNSQGQFELIEACFSHAILGTPLRCVRGKFAGAYGGVGTFQWTRAVQAIVLLLCRAKIASLSKRSEELVLLVGYRGSLASSLDAALSKEPVWLSDMFGADQNGHCLALRIINRTNTGLKRPGPVAVSLNQNFLKIECVQFENFDGAPYSLEEISRIEQSISNTDPIRGKSERRYSRSCSPDEYQLKRVA